MTGIYEDPQVKTSMAICSADIIGDGLRPGYQLTNYWDSWCVVGHNNTHTNAHSENKPMACLCYKDPSKISLFCSLIFNHNGVQDNINWFDPASKTPGRIHAASFSDQPWPQVDDEIECRFTSSHNNDYLDISRDLSLVTLTVNVKKATGDHTYSFSGFPKAIAEFEQKSSNFSVPLNASHCGYEVKIVLPPVKTHGVYIATFGITYLETK